MKAVLLMRISSVSQEDGHSLAAQQFRLKQYCKTKNLEILKEFQIVESSYHSERPQFQNMINFIKQQKETMALVCDKVDRLQRSFREVPILESLRKSGKLVLHFVSENQILDAQANNSQIMTYRLFIMLAENYANCISDNVKRSFEKKIREGTILRDSPVGYKNTVINGQRTVIIDPERGDKVKQLFERYAAGVISIRDMVGYAKEIGLNHKNKKQLTRSQIDYMLHNPFYYGYMRVKGKLYKHIYPPLISQDLFNRCNGIANHRHPTTEHKGKKDFLLRGFVRCRYCNRLFSPYLSKHKFPFLQPPTYKPCMHFNINERVVMDLLNENLKALHIGKDLDFVLKLLDQQQQEETTNRDKMLLDLNEQEQSLLQKKSRLMDLYLEQGIDKKEYEEKNQELDNNIANVRYRKSNLDTDIDQYYKNMKVCIKIADFSHFLMNSSRFCQKSQLLKILTSNFFVEGKNVVISMKKPFSTLCQKGSCPTWLGQLDSNQRHTD